MDGRQWRIEDGGKRMEDKEKIEDGEWRIEDRK